MRKETRLEEILKILDLKKKLEDKMFYKKKKEKDLISIFILLLLLCTRYEIKKRQKRKGKNYWQLVILKFH